MSDEFYIGKSRQIDYDKVDWSKSNIHLAMVLGVSKTSVSAQRRKRGLPNVKDRDMKYTQFGKLKGMR